ncbi:MAG: hypothetical protein KatS3mg113_0496 [Planctomycetaceae bacterium]|nr:MAG: hypothetical protein KatS3mg113_0496 [Planctomycetaceae bacterium]
MEEKKLTTAEILAKIRAQKAGGSAVTSGGAPPAASAEPPPAPPETPQGAPEATTVTPPPKPAAAPTSTKDILAAVRAQKGAGAAPQASSTPTPSSTKDILAAVRAGKSGQAAAPTATAAGEPKTSSVAPKPAGAVSPGLPPDKMLEQLRAKHEGHAPAPVSTGPTQPKQPPIPQKPTSVATRTPAKLDQQRRGLVQLLFGWLIYLVSSPFRLAWTACSLVGGISVLGTARYMFPNVLVEPPSKFKVGPPSDYPLNSVSNKWKDQFGIWIVHTDQYEGRNLIFALQTVCTHLGCTPNWLDGEQKFKCPCHGSGFYITGVNFEGPAPRPLERVGIRIAEDGMLEVDKSVKFQEELGQWRDPSSYVEVV